MSLRSINSNVQYVDSKDDVGCPEIEVSVRNLLRQIHSKLVQTRDLLETTDNRLESVPQGAEQNKLAKDEDLSVFDMLERCQREAGSVHGLANMIYKKIG